MNFYSQERQIRIQLGGFVKSRAGFITFMIYGLGTHLCVPPPFSEAEIGHISAEREDMDCFRI